MDEHQNFARELSIERKLRSHKFLIPFITYSLALLFLSGIYFCLHLYLLGHNWSVIPAAFLAHSFLIICLHDAAHKAITRSSFDRFFLNLSAALVLLPFYGEHYRKYHLTHHANTNKELDPICPPLMRKMYEERRWLYILCEFIPLIFTFMGLLNYQFERKKMDFKKRPRTVTINTYYLWMAIFVSALVIVFAKPPFWFVVNTLFALNAVSVLRNWCEHLGVTKNKESNTYWFPLGMGIGNHETHHHHSNFSWLTLMIGLFYRKKDTNPIKSFFGVLFNKSFTYYRNF